MTFSLNEVEATAKKATRGAGYPWGMAEEAGKAVRWLCAQGLDGCEALAELLKKFDGASLSQVAPQATGEDWSAPGGLLCPLMTGTAMSDRASDIVGASIRASEVAVPRLLFFFAASVAAQCKSVITLDWPGGSAVTDGARLSLHGAPAGNLANWVRIQAGGALERSNPVATRADPEASAWETLTVFAHRTYAPATEESRLKGAGAGITDRD